MERPGNHQRRDDQRHLSRRASALACVVIATQTVAICALWFDGLRRLRDAETALTQVDRDIAAMMMLVGSLQERQERHDREMKQ